MSALTSSGCNQSPHWGADGCNWEQPDSTFDSKEVNAEVSYCNQGCTGEDEARKGKQPGDKSKGWSLFTRIAIGMEASNLVTPPSSLSCSELSRAPVWEQSWHPHGLPRLQAVELHTPGPTATATHQEPPLHTQAKNSSTYWFGKELHLRLYYSSRTIRAYI